MTSAQRNTTINAKINATLSVATLARKSLTLLKMDSQMILVIELGLWLMGHIVLNGKIEPVLIVSIYLGMSAIIG